MIQHPVKVHFYKINYQFRPRVHSPSFGMGWDWESTSKHFCSDAHTHPSQPLQNAIGSQPQNISVPTHIHTHPQPLQNAMDTSVLFSSVNKLVFSYDKFWIFQKNFPPTNCFFVAPPTSQLWDRLQSEICDRTRGGGGSACPPGKFWILKCLKCHFLYFESTFKWNLKILNHTILNQHISHKKVGVLRLFHFWIFHRCDPMPNLRKFCHSLRHRGGGKKNIIIIIKKTFLTKGQCSKRQTILSVLAYTDLFIFRFVSLICTPYAANYVYILNKYSRTRFHLISK